MDAARSSVSGKADTRAPQPANPDPNEFDAEIDANLRRTHAHRLQRLESQVAELQWRQTGPERVQAHSDGRASAQLSHPEAIRLINELTAQLHKPAAYAG